MYYYSQADFVAFFEESSVLIHNTLENDHQPSLTFSGSFEDTPLIYSSRIMVVINAFMQLFSFGNIYVHFVFFCFFSFIGMTALLKSFTAHFPAKRKFFIALFFIPGVLFWGSAPLKESVVIGLVGLLIYFSDFGLRSKYSIRQTVFIVLLAALLAVIKIYVLLALLPALICNFFVAKTSPKLWLLKYSAIVVSFAFLAGLLGLLNPDLNVLKLVSDKQAKAISEAKGGVFMVNDKNFICINYASKDSVIIPQKDKLYKIKGGSSYLMWELDNMKDTTFVNDSKDTSLYTLLYKVIPAKTVISLRKIKPDLRDFIAYAPVALMNALMQPTIIEAKSLLQMASAMENAIIIGLLLAVLFFFDRSINQKKEILYLCLTFSLIVFILIGMTTPVTGAMVRYKTIAVLFLVSGCMLMINWDKIKISLFRK